MFDDEGDADKNHFKGDLARGGLDDLLEYATINTVDLVVIALPISRNRADYGNHKATAAIAPEYPYPAWRDRSATL